VEQRPPRRAREARELLSTLHGTRARARCEDHCVPGDLNWNYGYPKRPAAEIAVRVCLEMSEASGVERVEFCCFDEQTAELYDQVLREHAGEPM
jgi:hypothetical protein